MGETPGVPRSTVTVNRMLALPIGTDVTDDDQVTLVTDASGETPVTTAQNITAIQETSVEVILTLEEVT